MIKPEQIPVQAKMALRLAIYNGETDEAKIVADIINAWPNAQQRVFPAFSMETGHYEAPALILWLFPSEEKNDD